MSVLVFGAAVINWPPLLEASGPPSSHQLPEIKPVALRRLQPRRESRRLKSPCHSLTAPLTNTDTQWGVALSDPFHIAVNEDEQGPEEHGDDSGPDEDYNLHVGLVAWTLTEKNKESWFSIHMWSSETTLSFHTSSVISLMACLLTTCRGCCITNYWHYCSFLPNSYVKSLGCISMAKTHWKGSAIHQKTTSFQQTY